MELHTFDPIMAVGKCHYKTVAPGSRPQHLGALRDDQAVISSDLRRFFDAAQHSRSVVANNAAHPVHWFSSRLDSAPEGDGDRLVAQTNTENGNLSRKVSNRLYGHAGLRGMAGPRRYDQGRWRQFDEALEIYGVASQDGGLLADLKKPMGQIEDEGIAVVQDQNVLSAARLPLVAHRQC